MLRTLQEGTSEDSKLPEASSSFEARARYLRFLKSCIPSIVVTYWNPFSMSLVASLAVVVPVQVHSSSLKFSKCM